MFKKRKRTLKGVGYRAKFEKIAKSQQLKFLMDKPGDKYYTEKQKLLLKSQVKISVELLNLAQICILILGLLALVFTKTIGFYAIFCVLLGYMFPLIILFVLGDFRVTRAKNEIVMLQTYTIMLLRTQKTVEYILYVLYKRSNILKPYLKIAVDNYTQNPSNALKALKETTGNRDFEKLVIALEQALILDRSVSLVFLENHRRLGKELARIANKTRNEKKGIVSVVFLFLPFVTFIIVAGYPWFIYTIQSISEMPV